MNSCDFYYIICHLQLLCCFAPVAAFFWVWKQTSISEKIFAVYCLVNALLACLALYCVYISYPNHFVTNLETLLKLLLAIFWFPKVLNNKKLGVLSTIIGISFLIFWLYSASLKNKFYNLFGELNMLSSIYFTIFTGLGLYNVLTKDQKEANEYTPNYYFFLGLFVANCLNGFYNLYESRIIFHDRFLACTIESVFSILSISSTFLFTWAFIKIKKRALI
jgi:hypothetical protein